MDGAPGSVRVHSLLHPKRNMTNEGNPARVQVIHSEVRSQPEQLNRWLEQLVSRNGSDLLLVAEAPASIRVEGQLVTVGSEPLTGDAIEAAVLPALAVHARNDYQRNRIGDSSYRAEGLGRFRINLHRERGRTAATVRALPSKVPALADLHLPAGVAALAKLQRGLVIVGGATGSGKTTTLAGLVNEINQQSARHIVTIEDPIEYEHAHNRSVIEQVEIGIDAPDFPTALRAALRQAPDVIVVGEMRDPETARIALAAAETGHLVFTTLHTTDAASTVSRIADSFPQERQHSVRAEMAMALAAMLTQTLLPRRNGVAGPGGGAADGQLWRAPAHPPERAAASAPGDHDHPQAGVIHAGRIAGAAGVSAGAQPRRGHDTGDSCGGFGCHAQGEGILGIAEKPRSGARIEPMAQAMGVVRTQRKPRRGVRVLRSRDISRRR